MFPHALVDVSHRQCAIEVAAPARRGCSTPAFRSTSISPRFPWAWSTRTLLLKAEIVLWRREAERFRVETGRSFAPLRRRRARRFGARSGTVLTA